MAIKGSITLGSETYDAYQSTVEVEGTDVSSTGATDGQVLTADGNGDAAWEDPSGGGGTPEGTDVLSTGETSGKVLTSDGSGGASWQTVTAGLEVEVLG